jgi:hypothetical protein
VRHAAVVRDDQPVHAVLDALADLVDDAVLAVAAVLRVDVVVTGEPEEALALAATAARCPRAGRRLRGGGPARRAAEHARGGQAGAEQTGAAEHGTARPLVGAQRLVGYGGVEGGGERSALVAVAVAVVMTVVVVSMAVLPMPVTVSVPHVGLLCPAPPPVRSRAMETRCET